MRPLKLYRKLVLKYTRNKRKLNPSRKKIISIDFAFTFVMNVKQIFLKKNSRIFYYFLIKILNKKRIYYLAYKNIQYKRILRRQRK